MSLHNDTAEELLEAAAASTLTAHAWERLGSGFAGYANRAREDALDRRLELAELWGCSLSELRAEAVRRGLVDPSEVER